MKRIILISATVLTVLFCAGCILYSSFTSNAEVTEEVSVYEVTTESSNGERTLLAKGDDGNIKLYIEGDTIVLLHNDQETEFENWNTAIAEKTPTIYYNDLDENGENDIIILAYSSTDETYDYDCYIAYVLFVSKDDDGNYSYEVKLINNSYYNNFTNNIIREMSQPSLNGGKRLQFVMISSTESASYDMDTGIFNSDSNVWYAEALSDDDGNYYTLSSYSENGSTIRYNDEYKIFYIKIYINVSYEETDEIQEVGYIYSKLILNEETLNYKFSPSGTRLIVYDEYQTTALNVSPEESWEFTFNNSDSSSYYSYDKSISTLTAVYDIYRAGTSTTGTFSTDENGADVIEKIVMTESEVKYYAKSGYEFDDYVIENETYTLSALVSDEDEDEVYAEIQDSATITEEDGLSVLTIQLDKEYCQGEYITYKLHLG